MSSVAWTGNTAATKDLPAPCAEHAHELRALGLDILIWALIIIVACKPV
jgi:disulfide bond formation protein DsbB